jgi:hypothetical protein
MLCAMLLAPCVPAAGGAPPVGAKPLEVQISPAHPLIILYGPTISPDVLQAWNAFPPEIRDCAVVMLESPSTDRAVQVEGLSRECERARDCGIPVVIQIAGPDIEYTMHLEDVEGVLRRFDNIKGVQICETTYGAFSRFGGDEKYAVPRHTRYAIDTIRLCAKYGKFLSWQLQACEYAYIGSCELNRELYDTIVQYQDYVLPQHEMNQPQAWLLDHDSAMGLWVAGAVTNWGIEAQSWFWNDCHYEEPGGRRGPGDLNLMPGEMYGLMLLTGITAGATVYAFEPPQDIWNSEKHWKRVIEPLLLRVIREGLIPSREEAMAKMKVAYQLKPLRWYNDFLPVVRDLDEFHGAGNLIRGTYGVYRRAWEIEAIPNTGRYYWIPVLPAWTPGEVLGHFRRVLGPGELASPEEFRAVFDQYYEPEPQGNAWVVRLRKATYVANAHENTRADETYRVLLPAAPKQVAVTLTGEGARVEWRGNGSADRGYFVYRRRAGEPDFQRLNAEPVAETVYVDREASASEAAEYAVTALTAATEWQSGTVQMHEYHVFSNEESPLSEGAVLGSLPPREEQRPSPPPESQPRHPVITAILRSLGDFQRAIEAKDLEGVMDAYAPDYRDSPGRGRSYVRLCYQWFFRRYDSPAAVIDVYDWDLSQLGSTGIAKCRAWMFIPATSTVEENFLDVVFIPRDQPVIELTWRNVRGKWRIVHTDPPLPDLDQLLIYST